MYTVVRSIKTKNFSWLLSIYRLTGTQYHERETYHHSGKPVTAGDAVGDRRRGASQRRKSTRLSAAIIFVGVLKISFFQPFVR
jgi:hypothetical protein